MKKVLCFMAALMAAGAASAEIVVIQAEDAISLGSNYVVVADTNVPPYAFGDDYITPLATDTGPSSINMAVYDVGNLTSNALYDLYMRFHVGTNGYSDDSIFINSSGFGTNTVTFAYQNGIAGRFGLDGLSTSSPGFHWIKMNGTGDLTFLGAFNAGAGTNLTFAIAPREDGLDVDALAFVPADVAITSEMLNPSNSTVEVWAVGGIPTPDTADSTPLIEAYFLDGAGTVDTNTITMTVDGDAVAGYSISYSNFVTTVSYTPVSDLSLNETHTARVVVASSPGGSLVTNEFSFYVGNPISYVAVTISNTVMSASTNGPVGAGTAFVTNNVDAVDGVWRFRDAFGIPVTVTNEPTVGDYQAYSGLGNVYESNADDDCPRLKTSTYVDEPGFYQVYVYFNGNEGWDIRAGLEDLTNSLALFNAGNSSLLFTYDGGFFTHELYRADLGTVEVTDINTPISVYQEDAPGVGGRTWVEGIGIQPLIGAPTGPTLDPDIVSLTVAGGTVTLTWASETVGTYSIMHKTNLTDAVWTPVKTGIAGGDPTTTDSVSVSGDDQEFFSIEGN